MEGAEEFHLHPPRHSFHAITSLYRILLLRMHPLWMLEQRGIGEQTCYIGAVHECPHLNFFVSARG